MSLARRLALLAWADRAGAWIIEDDYDSEFRYIGRPLTAIQALDASKRVIYIGSFSKVLVPSIRLGYLIVPADLVDTFLATRSISNLHCPILDQMAVARFMQEGHFARHIRRMRSIYAERQQTLVEEARAELEGMIEVAPGEAGLHLIGWLTPPLDDVKVAEAARQRGLEITPISRYSIESPDRGGLMLGFGAIQPQQIRDGVRVLARVLGTLYGQREYAGSLSGTY
jgi:GntR family transcriptional regulator/MocR family aminotransferase